MKNENIKRGIIPLVLILLIILPICASGLENLELVSRSMYSNTYYNSTSNTYISEFHQQPINYYSESGFVPIDTNIKSMANIQNYNYGVNTGIYRAYFKGTSETSANLVNFVYNNYTLSLTPIDMKFQNQIGSHKSVVSAEIDKNKIIYRNQFGKGIDLEYRYLPNKLKEEIIINSLKDLKNNLKLNPNKEDILEIQFSLDIQNVNNKKTSIKIDEKNMDLAFGLEGITKNKIAFLDENDNDTFYLTKPIAYDNNKEKIELNYKYRVDKSNILFIDILMPYDWLETASYPVYIDPSIQINRSNDYGSINKDYSSGDYSYNPDNVYVGPDNQDIDRSWSAFSVSGINDSATITEVELNYDINEYDNSDCSSSLNLDFYKLDFEEFEDMTPNTQEEMGEIWNGIGSDTYYGYNIISSTGDDSKILDESISEVQSLIDGNPTDLFTVGYKVSNSDEQGEDCWCVIDENPATELYIVVSYTLPCYSNSNCVSGYYCNNYQNCVPKISNGITCDGTTYEGTQSSEDASCTSGYCDSDGLGPVDDGWCFSPYNTYFDGQETTNCEYSTDYGIYINDELPVGFDLSKCSWTGQLYLEDEVSSTCGFADITSTFECTDTGCSCSEPLCDELTANSNITTCSAQQSYFADKCNSSAGGQDRDNICRSSSFASGCTADSPCNGIEAGTNGCNNSCSASGWINNAVLFVNNLNVWNHSSYFTNTEKVEDFSQELNNALDSCSPDEYGYCNIPITIHSDNSGKINITNINVYFDIANYTWDTNGLSPATTYKVRIKSTDTWANSSWDESDSDFTIGNAGDEYKFYIKGNLGNNAAWLGSDGNIMLKGSCNYSTVCTAPENSFIIRNSTDSTVAYIDASGNFCIENGDCSDQSANCNSPQNAFIIKNDTINTIYIDESGDLCLVGTLYENANP